MTYKFQPERMNALHLHDLDSEHLVLRQNRVERDCGLAETAPSPSPSPSIRDREWRDTANM